MLVTTVYLLDVVDMTYTLCTHGSNQQGDSRTDVRTRHSATTKCNFPVVAYYYSTMGVAENYLCAHIDQFVDEEQTALKHLLMEQYTASGL